MRAARRRAHDAYGAAAAEAASDRFLHAFDPSPTMIVAGYWPVGGEIDPRPLLTELIALGASCALPVTTARDAPLRFRRWTPETVLVADALGVLAPPTTAAEIDPDLFLLPLLAFDRLGRRLGQGAGCYDRTLTDLRARSRPALAVGLAFSVQEMALVPAEAHDQPLDWVVTDRFALRLPGQPGRRRRDLFRPR